ncbi:MAG: hypothetical protein R3D53_13540 [Paracoccaceae bacterium]
MLEDLALERFGNRVPQFTFEVVRPAQGAGIGDVPDLIQGTRAVTVIPGTGEYSLATRRFSIISAWASRMWPMRTHPPA